MRFLTFGDRDAARRPGFLERDRIFPLNCDGLESFIALTSSERDALLDAARGAESLARDGVTLRAPVVPRKNVFCVGRNYLEHAKEGAKALGRELKLPDVPTFFTKAPTAIADPEATLRFAHRVARQLDWEGELAVVIGRRLRDADEASAAVAVFGYTCLNDISARDLQRAHLQWFKGKSLDASCPIGPWIVTPDEIGDARALSLETRVNGVVKQHASTASMIFSIPRIIAELSAGMTLEPGDVIATGTPEGVGFARTPPEFFADGDVVEVEIEKIGVLRNTITIS